MALHKQQVLIFLIEIFLYNIGIDKITSGDDITITAYNKHNNILQADVTAK